jgi:hypothetical protein
MDQIGGIIPAILQAAANLTAFVADNRSHLLYELVDCADARANRL